MRRKVTGRACWRSCIRFINGTEVVDNASPPPSPHRLARARSAPTTSNAAGGGTRSFHLPTSPLCRCSRGGDGMPSVPPDYGAGPDGSMAPAVPPVGALTGPLATAARHMCAAAPPQLLPPRLMTTKTTKMMILHPGCRRPLVLRPPAVTEIIRRPGQGPSDGVAPTACPLVNFPTTIQTSV
jgi:hypothetical protein